MATSFDDPRLYRWLRSRRQPQAEPARERPIQEELAQLQRQQQMAAALQEQGMQGPPEEWNRMAMVPEYGLGHGLTQLASSLGGAYFEKQAEKKREAIAKKLQDTEQDMYRSAVGGPNPANAEQTDPLAATTTPHKVPDEQRLMQLAMSPEGRLALENNSVLRQIVAGQMQPPEAFTLGPGETRFRGGRVVASAPAREGASPASVAEYEYARENGYKGSFQDWITAGGQSSRPSSVQEWEFYEKLPPEMQQRYLEMKRNPNIVVKDVNQVPTAIAPSVGFGTQATPLSTLPQVTSSAEAVKAAEAEGSAVGKAKGEITGGTLTKGSNARTVTGMLDIADPLIEAATGSLGGATRDRLASVFGVAPEGAQAIAQLKVLQAGLMTNMPRMEGPQSDRDVMLYREAAGQIGDPTVPTPIKKAAVAAIRQLQEKYKDRAASIEGSSPRRRYNPATGKIE